MNSSLNALEMFFFPVEDRAGVPWPRCPLRWQGDVPISGTGQCTCPANASAGYWAQAPVLSAGQGRTLGMGGGAVLSQFLRGRGGGTYSDGFGGNAFRCSIILGAEFQACGPVCYAHLPPVANVFS